MIKTKITLTKGYTDFNFVFTEYNEALCFARKALYFAEGDIKVSMSLVRDDEKKESETSEK